MNAPPEFRGAGAEVAVPLSEASRNTVRAMSRKGGSRASRPPPDGSFDGFTRPHFPAGRADASPAH